LATIVKFFERKEKV